MNYIISDELYEMITAVAGADFVATKENQIIIKNKENSKDDLYILPVYETEDEFKELDKSKQRDVLYNKLLNKRIKRTTEQAIKDHDGGTIARLEMKDRELLDELEYYSEKETDSKIEEHMNNQRIMWSEKVTPPSKKDLEDIYIRFVTQIEHECIGGKYIRTKSIYFLGATKGKELSEKLVKEFNARNSINVGYGTNRYKTIKYADLIYEYEKTLSHTL